MDWDDEGYGRYVTFRMSSDLLVVVRAQQRVMFSRVETPAV